MCLRHSYGQYHGLIQVIFFGFKESSFRVFKNWSPVSQYGLLHTTDFYEERIYHSSEDF